MDEWKAVLLKLSEGSFLSPNSGLAFLFFFLLQARLEWFFCCCSFFFTPFWQAIFLAEFLYRSPLRSTCNFSSLHPAWWFGACGNSLMGSFLTLHKSLPMLSHLSSFRVYGILSYYVDGRRDSIPGGLVEQEVALPVASVTVPAHVAPSHGMPQRPFNK